MSGKIEQTIWESKANVAPRVTSEHIESIILKEHFFAAYDDIRAANKGVNAA